MNADHQADADEHHIKAHDDVADARAAVLAAGAAVKAADHKMDGVVAMLGRHFRLGIVAVSVALVVGGGLLYMVLRVNDVVATVEAQGANTQIQTVANEVEVLRHRVHSKEGDLRLCTIALGARMGAEEAGRICAPVLGPEYEATKAKLASEERRLAELREASR